MNTPETQPAPTLSEIVRRHTAIARDRLAHHAFRPSIEAFIRESSARVVFEVGGGRSPLFDVEEVEALGIEQYVVNDLSAAELAYLDDRYTRALFDIQAGVPDDAPYAGSCDLVLSHFVFEHIEDPAAAWSTTRDLLRPGGTAIAYIPVLFSPPFVANWLLPETLAARVLRLVNPRRVITDIPKFPAHYHWCRASERYLGARLAPLGFSRVDVVPFYGHGYFAKLPGLRSVDAALTRLARRRGWDALASFAYVIATR